MIFQAVKSGQHRHILEHLSSTTGMSQTWIVITPPEPLWKNAFIQRSPVLQQAAGLFETLQESTGLQAHLHLSLIYKSKSLFLRLGTKFS